MRPESDRLVCLAGVLAAQGLEYSILKLGEARHLVLRSGSEPPELILVAHYDRAAGSPGALDNSCACIQLVRFASRLRSREATVPTGAAAPPSLLFVFTDAEEAPGSARAAGVAAAGTGGGAASQGSFALSRALASSLARLGPARGLPALVFDVTGRGGRLILSSASSELLARGGRAREEQAAAGRGLLRLARRAASLAGLEAPLEASLPWSDDLGLTLGGIPALALSLLPEEEALGLAAGRKPRTWDYLHSPEDLPSLAEEASFELMERFLDAIAEALRSGS